MSSKADPTPPDDVTLDALAGPWRIHQRKRGHRWSVDDLLTAHVAVTEAPDAPTHLDLGCGIGSVLMLVAYKLRHARHVGIEAQAQSHALCLRSLAHNALQDRVQARLGDFRESPPTVEGERFVLVTGTPPYLPVGTATRPRDDQRAHARLELRGGVEDYCLVGARHLLPGGTLVLCADGRTPDRTRRAAAAAGLHIHRWLLLIPHPRKGPLLHVVAMRAEPREGAESTADLLARDVNGKRTPQMQQVRAFFDMPAMPGDAD